MALSCQCGWWTIGFLKKTHLRGKVLVGVGQDKGVPGRVPAGWDGA